MTFKELPIGDIFEYREQAARRVAVKISERQAWQFQERSLAAFAHNRTVWTPAVSGRLMTAQDGRPCLMHVLSTGRVAGFVVVPVAFIEGEQAEFTLVTGDFREKHCEFDIILRKISQSREHTEKLLAALDVLVSML